MRSLDNLIETIETLAAPAVLATVVRVKGSSYRAPGARMVFGPEGFRRGSISAGCLETDVIARLDTVGALPQMVAYDMGSDLDLIWGTGMGCAGQVEIMLERVEPGLVPAWMRLCGSLLEARTPGVLATVLETRGGGNLSMGERFVHRQGGPSLLPADPALADLLIQESEGALGRGTAGTLTLRLPHIELTVLLEPVLPPFALWICGAGEHARPIARVAKTLGWFVGIVDHRPALTTPERFPEADRIIVGHPPEALRSLPFDGHSAALVLSHVYEYDLKCLEELLDAPLAYLGLQGNRRRCALLLEQIAERKGRLVCPRLFAPAGFAIGADTPEAIALSILSEIQAVLSGFPGGHLRDQKGRIHAPEARS